MGWNENLTPLNYVLAGLYPSLEDSHRIVDEAGIPRAFVPWRARAIDNWHEILYEADNRGQVIDVIRAALKQYPDNPALVKAAKGEAVEFREPVLSRARWKAELPEDTAEKIMGERNTLLPISFLEVGLERARSVARVVLEDGTGSGFLTRENIFVTNHHVLGSEAEARAATVQFNYQQNARGLDLTPANFRLDPAAGFQTSREEDWTLVKVEGDVSAWGAIELKPVKIKNLDVVNIIQHPGGGRKQLALYHNLVTYHDDDLIQYLTDTLPGSSGSPVFDSDWNVVALHHEGGWLDEPGSKSRVYRNEGININRVIDGLAGSGMTKKRPAARGGRKVAGKAAGKAPARKRR